jgi:hypothetical protein
MLGLLCSVVFFSSCSKDPEDEKPNLPTTYTFENVNYSGQTERLNMVDELSAEMKKGNTLGTQVDAQKLRDMFRNENNPFSFTSTKQLKDKTFPTEQAVYEALFDSIAVASRATQPGQNGRAGVVTSKDGTRSYLFDRNGFEYVQLVEKGLLGSLMYYQAVAVYLGPDKMNVDNQTVTPGTGTTMEHHWDEAFGYLGLPENYPTGTTARYNGRYASLRESVIQSGSKLLNAFIKGRYYITKKDLAKRDEAIAEIRAEWDKMLAATAINYLNQARTNITDDALRNHALSECVAFVKALKYNPSKKISDAQINTVVNEHIGGNLYEVTTARLTQAVDLLASIYGLESVKNQL